METGQGAPTRETSHENRIKVNGTRKIQRNVIRDYFVTYTS
jgi:hypothetical protein